MVPRAVRHGAELITRHGAEGSEGSAELTVAESSATSPRSQRRGGADRRAVTFRLGRRSPYHSFLMNYDDQEDDKMLPAGQDQVAKPATNQPSPDADGSTYDDFVKEWWPSAARDVHVHKKDTDDDLISAADPTFRLGKRDELQPTFRLGRADPTFRLGKRSSKRFPTFRLGKRESAKKQN